MLELKGNKKVNIENILITFRGTGFQVQKFTVKKKLEIQVFPYKIILEQTVKQSIIELGECFLNIGFVHIFAY